VAVDRLHDRSGPPTERALQAVLGPSAARWSDLVARIDCMGGTATFTWTGPRDGWVLRCTRAGRPFVTLEPAAGGFRALVILGRGQVAEAPSLPLGPRVRAILESARQYPDGRWLYIPVEECQDVEDIATLLEMKLPPTVRARVAAARAQGRHPLAGPA
jgi:hypothetical protein